MDEFQLINKFFKSIVHNRLDVIYGIGDDAACLQVPAGQQLLVSCDTLVAGVHFLASWDAYWIASRAVRVNVSDMAAMGAVPAWVTMALTIPDLDYDWLTRFAQGLTDALALYNIALVGGDTTRGPLCITLTVHGFAPDNMAVRRNGARVGDKIYVSGPLGAAALAVASLDNHQIGGVDKKALMDALISPHPRIDLANVIQTYATSAIDLSDGLSSDLNHICVASGVGARLAASSIPLHPLLAKYAGIFAKTALDFALNGGDDYELCITVSPENEQAFLQAQRSLDVAFYHIGAIVPQEGVWMEKADGYLERVMPKGYCHFF